MVHIYYNFKNFNFYKVGVNQWFIGIHRLPYEIIDNLFANLCLENEEMLSTIAHINKEFVEKVNFKWLDKEFTANCGPMKIEEIQNPTFHCTMF